MLFQVTSCHVISYKRDIIIDHNWADLVWSYLQCHTMLGLHCAKLRPANIHSVALSSHLIQFFTVFICTFSQINFQLSPYMEFGGLSLHSSLPLFPTLFRLSTVRRYFWIHTQRSIPQGVRREREEWHARSPTRKEVTQWSARNYIEITSTAGFWATSCVALCASVEPCFYMSRCAFLSFWMVSISGCFVINFLCHCSFFPSSFLPVPLYLYLSFVVCFHDWVYFPCLPVCCLCLPLLALLNSFVCLYHFLSA